MTNNQLKINHMKKLSLILIAIAFYTVGIAQEIHVNSATEFLRAIGSNKTIVIESGSVFNLTDAMLQLHNNYPKEYPMLDYYENEEQMAPLNNKVFSLNAYDGPEIALKGVRNLVIKGEASNLPLLLAEPRYAYIFSLYDCSNITFENIIMGHTNKGYCEGGVVALNDCRKINFFNCDLFGCGTEGLTANNVDGVKFNNSHIHDCSYSIMTLYNCRNFSFNNSMFFNNRMFNLVNIQGGATTTIRFTNCHFFQNHGQLFSLSDSIQLENCFITQPMDEWGDTEVIMDNGSVWSQPSGYPYDD